MKPPFTAKEPKQPRKDDCRCHAGKTAPLSILEQVKALGDSRNRVAFTVGGIVGAFVPFAVFVLSYHVMGESHNPVTAWQSSLENKMLLALIAAGGVFSAKSVFGYGLSAFAGDRWKAVGYAILIEGVLLLSPYLFLKILAGLYLLGINAIATGANLMERGGATNRGEKPGPPNAPGSPEKGERPRARAKARKPRKAHHGASRETVALLRAQGLSVSRIVAETGVSRRSVFRWSGTGATSGANSNQ